MTETAPAPHERDPLASSGVLREIQLLVRYRTPIILNVVIITVAAIVYSLLATEMYEAHSSILPAEDQGVGLGGLGQLLQNLPIQGANLPGVTTTTDLLAGILHSRQLQTPILKAYDLATRYKVEYEDAAFAMFNKRLRTSVSDEGILHVRFRDQDPELAAGVLNDLITELNHYNVNVRKSRGRQTREFIENRLKETADSLSAAEERLKTYQEENKVALSPDDMAAAESVGSLIGRKLALQVELEAIGQFMDPTSPPYVQRLTELRALDREIAGLPEMGLAAVRHYRDLKINEQLYLLLTAQLEQARIDEYRDLPVIQVLDAATPPQIRYWPKRTLIVISAFILSLAAGVLLAHLLEFFAREKALLKRIVAPDAG